MTDHLKTILDACCNTFGVTIAEVKSPSLRHEVSYCRRAFAHLAKENLPVSNKTIGAFINKSANAIQHINNTEIYDNKFKRILNDIKSKL